MNYIWPFTCLKTVQVSSATISVSFATSTKDFSQYSAQYLYYSMQLGQPESAAPFEASERIRTKVQIAIDAMEWVVCSQASSYYRQV